MTLTEEQIALLPTDDEVRAYHQHGWYHSKAIFTEEEIDEARHGSERFYACDLDDPNIAGLDRFKPKGEYAGLRKHDYASLFNKELTALVRHPLLAAVAARLAETPEIRLWHDQLLYKPTDDPQKKSNVGWHTDRKYWQICTSENMLTAWIPFHDCDDAMGTITMIDGSHRWPDNSSALDFGSSDLEGLEKKFDTGGQEVVKVPMNLKKGQVSFHHCLTIHGSGPNRSSSPRRSIAVHLQDADNRWRDYRSPDGRPAPHGNDALVRCQDGHPDYTDPQICPVLYP